MRIQTIKSGLKLFIALSMMPASVLPQTAFAKAPAASCKPKKACDDEVKKVQAQSAAVGATAGTSVPGQSNQGGSLNSAGTGGAAVACAAKKVCEKSKKDCKPDAGGCKKKDCEDIDSALGEVTLACSSNAGAAAGGAATQSAAGAGGGDGAMMGALLGAAAGVGLAMMMQKKKEEDAAKAADAAAEAAAAAAQQYNGALQANGTIDCSKPDALVYRDCNLKMENRCKTILDDPTCQQFSSRYCGAASGGAATLIAQPQSPPDVQFAVDPATLYGTPGEGMGTGYCKGVMGWNYCKAGGRESCPSCLQIQRNQSSVCAQNPSLCLAQNSISEIEKAKTTCPTDPAFADPRFTAGGGAQVPPSVAAGGLPAVVLPQSVGAGSASPGSGAGNNSGVSVQSVSGSSQAGYAAGGGGAAGGANGGANGTGSYSGAYVGGGREFASAGGMRPSGVGPSSEVEGQYGPSLFTTSSQVIRRRCQAGRLNNCP